MRVSCPQVGPAFHPLPMTWIPPPPPLVGHQPPPNFCLQQRCSGSLERSAREGRLLPRARIPWILIKEVFWLVRETSAVVVKAASDFMRFFSPSFWPQRGGNVATATFVAVLCYWLTRLFLRRISSELLMVLFAFLSLRVWGVLTPPSRVFLRRRCAARGVFSRSKGHREG